MKIERPLPYTDEMFPICTIPGDLGQRITICWGTMMGSLYYHNAQLGYVDVFDDLLSTHDYPAGLPNLATLSEAETFARDAWGDDLEWLEYDVPDGWSPRITINSFGDELPENWEAIAESLNSHIYAACVLHPDADPHEVAEAIWWAYCNGDIPSVPGI